MADLTEEQIKGRLFHHSSLFQSFFNSQTPKIFTFLNVLNPKMSENPCWLAGGGYMTQHSSFLKRHRTMSKVQRPARPPSGL
jgi:hypothetical protein